MVFKKGNYFGGKRGVKRTFPERTLPEEERVRRLRFREHRLNAHFRGIPFLLTYKQWSKIWDVSGHWHERGARRGQYVMARFGDTGPYSIDNVEIVRVIVNATAPTKALKNSATHRAMKRKAPTVSKANKGRVWSEESLEKCREARRKWWAKRKQQSTLTG